MLTLMIKIMRTNQIPVNNNSLLMMMMESNPLIWMTNKISNPPTWRTGLENLMINITVKTKESKTIKLEATIPAISVKSLSTDMSSSKN